MKTSLTRQWRLVKLWIAAILSNYQWYRRWLGGYWIFVRVDVCNRPMLWLKVTDLDRAALTLPHTILEQENWNEATH